MNFIFANLSRLILLINISKLLLYLIRQSQPRCISILVIINDGVMKINDFSIIHYDIISANGRFIAAADGS